MKVVNVMFVNTTENGEFITCPLPPSILVVTSLTGTVCHHVTCNEAVTDIACGQNKSTWLMESLISII